MDFYVQSTTQGYLTHSQLLHARSKCPSKKEEKEKKNEEERTKRKKKEEDDEGKGKHKTKK